MNDELSITETSVQQLITSYDGRWRTISFGCRSLDQITNGGISTRGITEMYGESAVGKTQLLLQLCLMVQLPVAVGGLNKKAVFISTEDNFPSSRLFQLIESFKRRFSVPIDFADNVFVEHIIEVEDLIRCVCGRLPQLMSTNDIGLIILDSIAGAFRLEPDIITRASNMRKICDSLLSLSNTWNCAVICSNQVAAIMEKDNVNQFSPCLGLSWANLVRTRFQISRIPSNFLSEKNGLQLCVRNIRVEFSSELESKECEFLIDPEEGIIEV